MRPVRTDGKLELEQQLVRRRSERIVGASELRANLAELARPVGDDERSAGVRQRCVVGAVAAVVARAGEPSPPDLIVAGYIEARAALQSDRHIAPAPDPL